jgi:hypothetical protein
MPFSVFLLGLQGVASNPFGSRGSISQWITQGCTSTQEMPAIDLASWLAGYIWWGRKVFFSSLG